MNKQVWMLDADALSNEMLKVINIVIGNLYQEGKIDWETFEDYIYNYFIVAKKPSSITSWWNKIFKIDEDTFKIIFFRLKNNSKNNIIIANGE